MPTSNVKTWLCLVSRVFPGQAVAHWITYALDAGIPYTAMGDRPRGLCTCVAPYIAPTWGS